MATITDCGINPKLVRAVIRQIGDRDSLQDVARHGADAGYPGFTYYTDTVAFFERNRAAIAQLVCDRADDLGESPLDMVAGFGCLAGHGKRTDYDHDGNPTPDRRRALAEHHDSVGRCLYGRGKVDDDDITVANALAWFALEEVAGALNPDA